MVELIVALVVGVMTILLSKLVDAIFKVYQVDSAKYLLVVKQLLLGFFRYGIPFILIVYSYIDFEFNKAYILFTAVNFMVIVMNFVIAISNETDRDIEQLKSNNSGGNSKTSN